MFFPLKIPTLSEYFMVAIASYSSEEFNIASIESPQFGSASEYCFQFYYNFHVSRSISTYTVGYNPQKKVLLKLPEKCNNYFLSICAKFLPYLML